ncbi:DEAD/DEAH box helicase [Helicobacter sp. 13S00401-1]|nr:DEAD/DEAH box helicase [Helicobacter sp. 13S00401-1]PAF50186.1 DEAD/DEAH box helicase [Helicobacter sp. 13S00401-1]
MSNQDLLESSTIGSSESNLEAFKALGLKEQVINGVKEAGFSTPSPVQEKAIPPILEGKDVIAQAQTGTGKTAAFALPILNMLEGNCGIEALVITPTRELAMQISDEVFKLGKFLRTKTVCVYGGQSIRRQVELIEKNPQVMIATPGRLLDHLKHGHIKNFNPKIIVLDESDEMLDMGFIDDIEEIFSYIPNSIQTLLFSATMPSRIKQLADKILCEPVLVKITSTNVTNTDISQRYYIINDNERNDALTRLIDTEAPGKSLVFIRTKREADEVNGYLQNKGYKSVALHGDMDQRARRSAIESFKRNDSDILVATDVAARGLDISDISHVFNYHMPLNIESYVHRIGRTGRAGKKGVAITLATPLEYKELKRIQAEISSTLELYEIPAVSNDELINKILSAKVTDDAILCYESIKDKIDNAQLILRLLSLNFSNSAKIGMSKKDFEASFVKDLKKRGDFKSHDRRGSGGSGRRFGSGGGSSGGRSDRRSDRGGERSERSGDRDFKKSSGRKEFQKGESFSRGASRSKKY